MSIARIVAATDFSDASARALARAAQLAALHGVALDLVTVLPATWLGQMRTWLAGAEVQANAAALEARLRQRRAERGAHGANRCSAGARGTGSTSANMKA